MKFDKFCIRCLLAPPDRCPPMPDFVRHLSDTCLVDANTLDIRNFSFFILRQPLFQVRHRRTCREARAPYFLHGNSLSGCGWYFEKGTQRKMGEELTQKDVEKIEKEIEYRKLVVRKDAIEAVKEARAQGDLSENFEYYAAKKDKNQNESRIRYLERMLKNAKVISEDSKEDEVGLNNTVQVYFEEDDVTETYKVVTSIRGNSLKGLISIESPLGKALLGHKVNDRVRIKVDDDYSYDVIIKSIENTVDDGSDSIRKF